MTIRDTWGPKPWGWFVVDEFMGVLGWVAAIYMAVGIVVLILTIIRYGSRDVFKVCNGFFECFATAFGVAMLWPLSFRGWYNS